MNVHPSFKLYFHPRIIAVFFLGISSGLPLALVLSTLTVWLTEEGVSRTSIGLFAAVTTPYALKFLWSPLVDQLPLPWFSKVLGRRRGWMVFTQLVLMGALVLLGLSDPAANTGFTALCALIVAIASASQDIVIDAYRVETLHDDQQGAGAAVIVFGYRVGMLLSGAGALILAEYVSWTITYAAMGALVSIGMVTVLIAGEPSASKSKQAKDYTKKSFREWLNHAVVDPFADFARDNAWLLILVFVILYKLGDAFAGVMTNPFLIELGFSKTEIAGVVKTFGFFATIAGALLGGILVHRLGGFWALMLCGILQMASNLVFVLQAYVGHNLAVLALTIGLENLSGGMGTAAFVAYLSGLCNIAYTATQYALLSSLAAVGRTWFSAASGFVVDMSGWVPFFVFSTVLALPGIWLLWQFREKLRLKEATHGRAAE